MFNRALGFLLRAKLPGSKRPRCGAAAQSARNAKVLLLGLPAASSLSRRLVCRHGHRRFARSNQFRGLSVRAMQHPA
jgi:hypothetical protein